MWFWSLVAVHRIMKMLLGIAKCTGRIGMLVSLLASPLWKTDTWQLPPPADLSIKCIGYKWHELISEITPAIGLQMLIKLFLARSYQQTTQEHAFYLKKVQAKYNLKVRAIPALVIDQRKVCIIKVPILVHVPLHQSCLVGQWEAMFVANWHRPQNSLEQSGAGMCSIATSSSNYTKERKIKFKP